MRSVKASLDLIEKQLGKTACVCPEHSNIAIVVIKDDWGPDDIEHAEAAVRFTCPTHGVRSPLILRLSESDAKL